MFQFRQIHSSTALILAALLLAPGGPAFAFGGQLPFVRPMPSDSTAPRNRLAGEKSPYLRQHAGNPVDWQPWDAAALDEARQTGKPILRRWAAHPSASAWVGVALAARRAGSTEQVAPPPRRAAPPDPAAPKGCPGPLLHRPRRRRWPPRSSRALTTLRRDRVGFVLQSFNLPVVQPGDLGSTYHDGPVGRGVQSGEAVHQRRLPGAGRFHHRGERTGTEFHAHPVQCAESCLGAATHLTRSVALQALRTKISPVDGMLHPSAFVRDSLYP